MIAEKSEWKGHDLTLYWIRTDKHKLISPIWQVSAFCFDEEGQILLIRSSDGMKWVIPGGTPEEGEKFEETLIREVQEEASCIVGGLRLLGAVKVHFPDNPDRDQGDNFYQLRYFARIQRIDEQTEDPALGIRRDRVFVKPEDFFKYIDYNKRINSEILRLAKEFI